MSVSPGSLFAEVMQLKEFAENLPRRINPILERVASNSLEVKVDAIDEKMLLEGFIKVANRITMGLILASLIVGAALLMRVETSFRILGYPGLAIVSPREPTMRKDGSTRISRRSEEPTS